MKMTFWLWIIFQDLTKSEKLKYDFLNREFLLTSPVYFSGKSPASQLLSEKINDV